MPNSIAIAAAVSGSRVWLIVALRPWSISFFWMSLVFTPVAADSDLTVIGSSMPTGSPRFPAGSAIWCVPRLCVFLRCASKVDRLAAAVLRRI